MEAIDTEIFRWINGHYCDGLDWFLWTMSQHWMYLVVIVAVFCLTTLREEPRRWWFVGLAIALCFLLADQLSVICFKEIVRRPRPCHVLDDVRMFRTSCGGAYGFVSSHAANVLAVATFLVARYWKNCRRWLLPATAFWSVAVCYSRCYLGKHYPGDVVCGALLGIGVGFLVFYLAKLVDRWQERRKK